MRKAKLAGWSIQDIEEVDYLEDIEVPGTYAVKGFELPMNVMEVTNYGAAVLSKQYPYGKLFYGADGKRYFAMGTGEFVD